METRYPIRKDKSTEYSRYRDVLNKIGDHDGQWLVANNCLWHGGIHISGKNVPDAILTAETAERAIPLQCMAGGKIVALRVNKKYKEAPYGEDQKINYSSTFVLVRSMHSPDSSKPNSALTFYTLYMHLAPLSDYPLRKIARVIEPTGLKKRTVTSHEIVGQPTSNTTNGTFLKGTQVEVGRTLSFTHNGASKDFCAVRKIENGKPEGDSFWVAAGEDNLQPVSEQYAYLPDWMQEAVRTDTYDSVIIPASPIDISAGSPIGFLGRDDAPNERDEVQADWQSHIEVFSNDSRMPRFLSNPENLTSNDKGWIKAKEGAPFYTRANIENIPTFAVGSKTVSSMDAKLVIEPEQSNPIQDKDGKWWFQFEENNWLAEAGVEKLNPYDLIARNFKPLEQPPTGDFSKTLVEPWMSEAFRWFDTLEQPAEGGFSLWKGVAGLIDNYRDGAIEKFMFNHLKGLLLSRLNYTAKEISGLRRRLIVKHDSEWFGKSEEPCWKKILDECGDKERPWLKQWRDDVEWMSKVDGFKEKAQRQVWHFHPLEFLAGIKTRSECACGRDITLNELKSISRYISDDNARKYIDAINIAFREYDITTCLGKSHILAQLLHESGRLRATKEGDGERKTYQPWYGRGLIQLTHEDKYLAYGAYAHEDFYSSESARNKILNLPHSVESAFWYLKIHTNCSESVLIDDFNHVCYQINGGFNHYDDRLELLNSAIKIFHAEHLLQQNDNGRYQFETSAVYNSKKAALGWGLWQDPATNKPGMTKNKSAALAGYERFLEILATSPFTPSELRKKWYYIPVPDIESYVRTRIAALRGS